MQTGLSVFPLADRLRRAALIEQTSIRHLCGWFVAARPYEFKHRFGYHAWDHAEHADWIHERLRLLRGGMAGASVEPALLAFVDLTLHAPDEYAYVRGAYQVLKAELLSFYEETLDRCDASANAYDARLLNRIIPELREQLDWSRDALSSDPNPERSEAWATHLRETIDAIGGLSCRNVSGPDVIREHPLTKRFSLPDRLLFDERITDEPLTPHDVKVTLPYEEALREQFRVFFNEIYAAAMLAALLYDGIEQHLPWGFVHDFTRQFWDECRHSEFGAVRLRELGYEPDRCDQRLFLNSLAMPLIHRTCYLTLVLEPYYMPRKKPRFEEYRRAGDARSPLFADHDWSDEINHVRLGKDWLEKLLEDDARDVLQVKKETEDMLVRIEGEHAEQLSPF